MDRVIWKPIGEWLYFVGNILVRVILRELENWRRSNLSLKINVSVPGVWSYFVDSVLRGSFYLEKWSNQIVVIWLAIWKPTKEEIIESFGGPCHLSTILLKNFHLFKIIESVISFCLNFFSDLTILNKWVF